MFVETVNLLVAPNPFTNTTTISYQLPEAMEAELLLYDISSKTVKLLQTWQWHDAGHHEMELTNTGLSAGMYFLQLRTGKGVAIRKVVLNRE